MSRPAPESPWEDYDIGTVVRAQRYPDDGELLVIGFTTSNAAEKSLKGLNNPRAARTLRNSGAEHVAVMAPVSELDAHYDGWRDAIYRGPIAFYKHATENYREQPDTDADADSAAEVENRYGLKRGLTALGYVRPEPTHTPK